MLDSTFANPDKKYYLEIFVEQFKYAIKKKKVVNAINEELKLD